MSNQKVTQVIFSAIDELKDVLGFEENYHYTLETHLFGEGGPLDSLGLVNLVVLVEQKIEDELGTRIVLADERALSQNESPFKTIGTLVQYVSVLAQEG